MIKELQLCDPEIKGLQYHAYPLSIMGMHEHFYPWFYSEYTQLYCYDDMSNGFYLDFFTYTYYHASNMLMDVYRIPREFTTNNDQPIIEFIERSIKNDYYITFHLDEYYLEDRVVHGKEHNCHDILISGFNDKDKMFKVSGYDRNMNYSHTYISYLEVELGFENVDFIDWQDNSKFRDVFLLKIKKEGNLVFDEVLNLNLMRIYLKDYLNGYDSSERGLLFYKPISGLKFGINIYSGLKLALLNILEDKPVNDMFSVIKAVQIIYEHKKVMKNRIKFLEDSTILSSNIKLSEQYEEVESKSLIMKNLTLKYFLIKQKEILMNIINLLDQSLSQEVDLLSTLIHQLEQNDKAII